jgi:hypothetical protein
MAGTYSRVKTWIDDETLTHTALNAEFNNILTYSTTDGIDDASTDATAMRATAAPYPASTESLATDLRGEIQRLRYMIKAITGEEYWYSANATGLGNIWSTVTTSATPAAGTCAVQFVFKDSSNTTMATPVAGTFYVSELSTGLEVDTADTGVAVLTNGAVTIMDTGIASYYKFVTTAAGLLGITITANEDSYYIVFEHPTGKMVISTACAVNGA